MSRRNLKVKYIINNDGKKETMDVDNSTTVSDFIDLVKSKHDNDDICAVFIRGRALEQSDLLLNHVKSKDDILIVSDDSTKKPEDFVDPDMPIEPSERQKSIESSLRESLTNTEDEPKQTFGNRNEFKVFTTVNPDSLLKGDKLTLMKNDTFEANSEKIKGLLEKYEDQLPKDYEMHIFLPGGVPYLSGSLDSYYMATDVNHNHLYVIVTKKLGDLINEKVIEPCNCTGRNADALSPFCDSSQAGLTQIACLLGYFFHNGIHAEHLWLVLAKVTRFAPLITNIFRFLEKEELTYLNVISITGPLYTFFRSLLPKGMHSDSVFEYTLNLVAYISLLTDIEYLAIHTIDWEDEPVDKEDELCDYFRSTNQQKHVVTWQADTTNPGFKGFNINDSNFKKVDTIFTAVTNFKPIPPLSLHFVYYPTFIRGRDEKCVMLFLREVANKENYVKYIDPLSGKEEESSIEDLAKKVRCDEREDAIDLIDKNSVEQINIICFDVSTSMKFKLEGSNCIHGEKSRAKISSEFLHALISQSYRFRVSSMYGLLSFGDEVKTLQDITPMNSDFIKKLGKITPKGKTLLWDAIAEAQRQLVDIITPIPDEEEEEEEEDPEVQYPNARLRIIVITDGSDNKSKTNPVNLAKQLLKNNIIVDTVLVSLDELNNECCALSKITGGLCFRPNSLEEGLKIFEQEAFLNVASRHLTGPLYGTKEITDEDFKKASESFKAHDFDTHAQNQDILNAKYDFPLSTPLYMCYQYKEKDPETIRKKRALTELNVISHHPIENCQVYSSHANPVEWRIFIKGPEGTPYEDKWLNIFMTLPNEYPFSPPKFKFLTIPFHPNISSEGNVIFSFLTSKYSSASRICDIIKGMIKLLANPEAENIVNHEAMDLYTKDKKAYNRKQQSQDLGEDNYENYINSKVYDEIPEQVEIEEDTRTYLYMTNANNSYRGKVIDIENDKYYEDP
ncbi:hypothetical protein M9Y10_029068 [Tritrichomonas musculus]|uniref:UBC core domain-containing protein n=1 Tax=Tritrichomonas musculus TaxID=1915356 RepID=A0ABR2KM84_9EUKA